MKTLYKSNLTAPDYASKFTNTEEIEYVNLAAHSSLCDPEIFPGCGYATHDEAAILYNLAVQKPGTWLEIGAHTGWTAVHLYGEGNKVVSIEPEFEHVGFNRTKDPKKFYERFKDNVVACIGEQAFKKSVKAVGQKSWDYLPRLKKPAFDGVFIDGEHEPPFPVVDAMLALRLLKPGGIIVFHDYIGGPVQAAVEWLKTKGFSVTVYNTPQFLAVCHGPDFVPPSHKADPRCDAYAAGPLHKSGYDHGADVPKAEAFILSL